MTLHLDFCEADLHEFGSAMRTNLALLFDELDVLRKACETDRCRFRIGIEKVTDEIAKFVKQSETHISDMVEEKLKEVSQDSKNEAIAAAERHISDAVEHKLKEVSQDAKNEVIAAAYVGSAATKNELSDMMASYVQSLAASERRLARLEALTLHKRSWFLDDMHLQDAGSGDKQPDETATSDLQRCPASQPEECLSYEEIHETDKLKMSLSLGVAEADYTNPLATAKMSSSTLAASASQSEGSSPFDGAQNMRQISVNGMDCISELQRPFTPCPVLPGGAVRVAAPETNKSLSHSRSLSPRPRLDGSEHCCSLDSEPEGCVPQGAVPWASNNRTRTMTTGELSPATSRPTISSSPRAPAAYCQTSRVVASVPIPRHTVAASYPNASACHGTPSSAASSRRIVISRAASCSNIKLPWPPLTDSSHALAGGARTCIPEARLLFTDSSFHHQNRQQHKDSVKLVRRHSLRGSLTPRTLCHAYSVPSI